MPTKKPTISERDKALTHISAIRFHKVFYLPADLAQGRANAMRVTYSDCDYREDENGAVVLVIGGMFGGRYVLCGSPDACAKKSGVRVISVDKFGMGGTERVPVAERVRRWLEIVPALLDHIGVKHVALICHSAGAIYLLNTLLTLRHILHPKNPFIAFIAPWVHPTHSKTLTTLSVIPTSLIANVDPLMRFMATKINPAFAFSSGLMKPLSRAVAPSSPPTTAPDVAAGEEVEDPEDGNDDAFLYSAEKSPPGEFWLEWTRFAFVEEMTGGSDEALLCLKRGNGSQPGSWGLFEDFDKAVELVVEQERKREKGDEEERLTVKAFYASSDGMVGKRGNEWFDACWTVPAKEGLKEELDRCVKYEAETIEGAGHDEIVSVEKGVVPKLMKEIAASFSQV